MFGMGLALKTLTIETLKMILIQIRYVRTMSKMKMKEGREDVMNVEKVTEEKRQIPSTWTPKHEARKVFKTYGDMFHVDEAVIRSGEVNFHAAKLLLSKGFRSASYGYFLSEGYLSVYCNPDMDSYDIEETHNQLLARMKPPRIIFGNRLKFDPTGKELNFKIGDADFTVDYVIEVNPMPNMDLLNALTPVPTTATGIKKMIDSTRKSIYENTLLVNAIEKRGKMDPITYQREYRMAIMLWCELCSLDVEFDDYKPSPINRFMEKGGFNFGPEHIKGKD